MNPNPDELIDGMLALRRLIRREWRVQLVLLWLLFAGAGGLAAAVYMGVKHSGLWAALSIGLGLVALRLGRDVHRLRRPEQHPVWVLLHQNPQSVVWVYALRLELMPLGIRLRERRILLLRLDNGRAEQLRGTAPEIESLLRLLRRLLPGATFGYAKHLEQLYALDPEWLRLPEK